MERRFVVTEALHEGTTTSIFRAVDASNGGRVVLKRLRSEHKSLVEEERLRHEFSILSRIDAPGVARAVELAWDEGALAMVLLDRGGEALHLRMRRGKLGLRACIAIGASIAAALEGVHAARIIHKDVNPHNIVVCGDGAEIELIDFELATAMPRGADAGIMPDLIEGTLAYIAPEQTGRTNRVVDTRADLYGFGATLYTMLAGRPPFEGQDPIELVHAHIARRPVPLSEKDPSIPAVVSAIVSKLLAKMPEERYQSAAAVRQDLETCLARLDAEGRIEGFVLGASDVSERFQIPEKLEGRGGTIAAIGEARLRAAGSAPLLVLVSGPLGIGKSALLREGARVLAEEEGRVAASKADEREADVPYAAITRALSPLLRELCASSEEKLAQTRQALVSALGSAAPVLVDVLPDLAVVLGKTEGGDAAGQTSPELPVEQARERARFAFVRLFQVLAKDGLALFLDDLDAADAASLDLVERLVREGAATGLVIVGSCREVILAQLDEAGAPVVRLSLEPLGQDDVHAIVRGAVHRDGDDVARLAALVHKKTLGNPLFVGAFLSMLHRDGLIDFDHASRAWRWDQDAIERAPVAADVLALLAERASRLGPEALALCRIAACLGLRFDRATLAEAADLELEQVDALLAEAAEEGLVIGGSGAHAFLHERVREVVYAPIPEAERRAIHLRLGRILRAFAPREKLFELLGHLNLAEPSIDDPNERLGVAWMNLEAGKRARAAAAFDAASAHFEAGLSFLPKDAFRSAKEEAVALSFGAAEAAYSCGRRARAEKLYAELDRHAETDLERLRVDRARVRMLRSLNEFPAALDIACAALAREGIVLPKDPGLGAVLFEFAKAERALWKKSVDELLALPFVASERSDLVAAIAEDTLFIAFFERPMIQSVLACKLVSSSRSRGLSPASAAGFAGYAFLVRMIRRDVARADELGRMAQRLLDRFPSIATAPLVHLTYAVLIAPFRYPPSVMVEEVERTHRAALEAGDRAFTYFAGGTRISSAMLMGRPLGEVLAMLAEDRRRLEELARATNTPFGMPTNERFALFLQGKTRGDGFDTDDLDEATYVADLERDATKLGPAVYSYSKALALVIMGRAEEARRTFEAMPKDVEDKLVVAFAGGEFLFTRGLVLAATARARSPLGRAKDLLVMHACQRKLAALAKDAPASFQHKAELLAAECARLEGRIGAAVDHYERAAKLAHASRFLHEEAIALERAGLFWLERENAEISRSYLGRAIRVYGRWGATAKVAALEKTYPALARSAARSSSTGEEGPTTTRTTSSVALDARAMVRASQAVSGELTLERLLRKLIEVAVQATGAERGVLVLEGDSGLAVAARISAQGTVDVPSEPIPIAEAGGLSLTAIQYVARTGKSLLCKDASSDPITKSDPHVASRGTRSLLVVPIVRQGDLRGALYLENDLSTGAFTADRLSLCEVLAAQMSISVENARLYAGLERLVDERTRALASATARVVELEKTATEARMAGGFAHEMRNALTAAKMLLSVILPAEAKSLPVENGDSLLALYGKLDGRVDAEVMDDVAPLLRDINANEERIDGALRLVWSSIERALGTTQLILEYAKLGSERPSDSPLDLSALVRSIAAESQADFAAHGVELVIDVPAAARVRGKDEHWYSILKNLVLNARDALLDVERPEGRRIRVGYEERGGRVVVSVEDNGAGIADEDKARIFEPFFSTKPDTGTGLGLGVVKKLVALYGGTIAAFSELGRGTRFSIELPPFGPP